MYAHFPGLRVVVPSTPYDAKGLMKKALRCNDPVIFLEHRELLNLKGPVPAGDYEIEFGRAAVVREGRDVTVVSLALMVHQTLKACERLAARRHLGRAHRPADGRPARSRHDPPVGRQDRTFADRRRGLRTLRAWARRSPRAWPTRALTISTPRFAGSTAPSHPPRTAHPSKRPSFPTPIRSPRRFAT